MAIQDSRADILGRITSFVATFGLLAALFGGMVLPSGAMSTGVVWFLALAPTSSLTVNNYFGILQGVIQGLGIGSLPDYLTGDFPDLADVDERLDDVHALARAHRRVLRRAPA